MITDVYLVYNDDKHIKQIGGTYTLKVSPFFHFIDDRTLDGRREAFRLKSAWGSRITPFALCMKGENAVKAFYSETGGDIIKELIDYLNEQNIYS